MDARRAALLDAIGIDRFVTRRGTPEDTSSGGAPADEAEASVTPTPHAARLRPMPFTPIPVPDVADADVATLGWEELQGRVAACTRCALSATRSQTVFGVGDRAARWLVVGEAPGADEDRQGEPFVGRAGQLLNAMLRAAGLERGEVYIANVLKCRPPGNRDPGAEEARCCLPFLHRQIALVNPDLVLCLGRIAAQNLLGVDTTLGQLRGRVHRLAPLGKPVIVSYHPAYLLRSPSEKRKSWADLRLAIETARGQRA
jgi:DNA polymerase